MHSYRILRSAHHLSVHYCHYYRELSWRYQLNVRYVLIALHFRTVHLSRILLRVTCLSNCNLLVRITISYNDFIFTFCFSFFFQAR